MVQYQSEDDEVTIVQIKCTNFNKLSPRLISEIVTIYTIPVFIKAFVFHHVGISWLLQKNYRIDFDVDEKFLVGVQEGHGNFKNHNLHGSVFENFFVTVCQ